MKTLTVSETEMDFVVKVPDEWFLVRKPVPQLVVPQQLFGASNEEPSDTPSDSSQPRPMIQLLSPMAVFLWGCFQRPSDPDPRGRDPTLDNSGFDFPLSYDAAVARDSTDAREWLPSRFVLFELSLIEASFGIVRSRPSPLTCGWKHRRRKPEQP